MNRPSPSNIAEMPSLSSLHELFAQGKFKELEELCKQAIQQNPTDTAVLHILGSIYDRVGLHNDAIAVFSRILAIDPSHWQSLFSLAGIMRGHEHYDQALELYQSVLHHRPSSFEALEAMQNIYARQGNIKQLLATTMLAVKLRPDMNDLWARMSKAMELLRIDAMPADFTEYVTQHAPLEDRCQNGAVDVAARLLFISDANFQKMRMEVASGGITALMPYAESGSLFFMLKNPLFLRIIHNNLVSSVEFERLMVAIRYALLQEVTNGCFNAADKASARTVLHHLASYFFLGEYIAEVMEEEKAALATLEKSVSERLASVQDTMLTPQEEAAIFVLAMYKPLKDVESGDAWPSLAAALPADDPLRQVLQITYLDFAQEMEIARNIKSIGSIKDSVSQKVREQYEENPYPRWDALQEQTVLPSENFINRVIPFSLPFSLSLPENPEILVAGCGTGRQTVMTAKTLPQAHVVSIDLSRRSLSYAMRMSRELGISNTEFFHMDILDVPQLDRSFDAVLCSGVLHHMKDPMAGWRTLTDTLKPGGFMSIALYSKLARQNISAAREEIAREGYSDSPEDIRRYRQEAIKRSSNLMGSCDFYTESAIRDLLFHRQEHQFTLPQIKKCLEELKLEFLGFGYNTIIYDAYDRAFPLRKDYRNLDFWAEAEEKFPNMFASMYEFWCYKPA